MRTQDIHHLMNAHREPKTDQWCCCCQKDIKGEPKFFVHLVDGGLTVLHPKDEKNYQPDGGDLGFHPVGPDCGKKIGTEWLHKAGG